MILKITHTHDTINDIHRYGYQIRQATNDKKILYAWYPFNTEALAFQAGQLKVQELRHEQSKQ